MADRFFASYEDEFSSRPNLGRSSGLTHGSAQARTYPAPNAQRTEPHWPERHMPNTPSSNPHLSDPHWPADPYDRAHPDPYDRDYSAPKQPIFAPLDRRATQIAPQSYPAQAQYNYPRNDHAYAAQDEVPPYDPPSYGQPERGFAPPSDRIAKITQWAGSITSILVLLGAVYWAYELAVRDARGIPVVRAAEGPLRIAPATPGGEISANQGLAVNAIAAKGGSEALPEVVTLAPAPVQLALEDVATSAEAPAASETPEATPNVASAEDIPAAQAGSALTDLAAKTPDVMPISDEAAVEAALAMALSDGEPVTKSNTDAAQPAELVNLDTAPDAGVTAPPTSEVDPASIPAGTKMVQLGAFDDEAAARGAWAALQTQFTDLIGPKALVVQQAKSGGRVFFRLRAHGFADEDETRRFCAALLAENASCIPVSQR